ACRPTHERHGRGTVEPGGGVAVDAGPAGFDEVRAGWAHACGVASAPDPARSWRAGHAFPGDRTGTPCESLAEPCRAGRRLRARAGHEAHRAARIRSRSSKE